MSIGLFYLTRPRRLARITADLLTRMTSAQVTIRDARIHLDGSIELHGVDFEVHDPDGGKLPMFRSDTVLLKQHLPGLLRGKFIAQSLTFLRPRFYLTEDRDHKLFNYQMLQSAKLEKEKKDPTKLPDTLPEIFIRDGAVLFGEIQQGAYTQLGKVNLSGQLSTIPGQKGLYAYQLRQDLPASAGRQGPALSGQFNLNNLAILARLEHFTLDDSHRQLLPSKFRQWWDQLDPQGSIPDVQFGYDPAMGMHAQLEVKDVALTLPGSDPPVTMRDVAGKFTLVGETLAITQFKGMLEDVQYEINGQVDGLDKHAPFNITARISRFTIPQEPRYLPALPRVVQKQFQRFAPSGEFSALVNVKRTTPDGEIFYDGQVEVDKAQGVYAKFPYPLKDVRGVLRFNNQELRIVALHGSPVGGGRITITGVIAPPRDDAAVDIRVSATDIPINDNLYTALEPNEKEVVEAFFDKKALQAFEEKGLLQSSQRHAELKGKLEALQGKRRATSADDASLASLTQEIQQLEKQLAIPVFDLGGMLDLQVHMVREYGPDKPYLPTTVIDVSRVSVMTEPWNYPLKVVGGKLTIAPGKATLGDIQVRGLDGLSGVVRGEIDLPRKSVPGSKSNPKVSFEGTSLAVSPLLLASLPPAQARWIDELAITGSMDLSGKVFRIDLNPMDFDIHATLRDARAKPFGGRVEISPVAGNLLIHRKSMAIQSLQGKVGDASLAITGQASWQDKQTDLKLQIQGRDIDFAQPVLDLVPSKAQALETIRQELETYKPAGRYDANVELSIQGKADPQYRVTLLPRHVSFNFNGQRAVFDGFSGQVVIDPAAITLTDCVATYDDKASTARFDGVITLGDKPVADVNLQAQGRRLDATTLALLPPGVTAFIQANSVRTRYQLTDGRLIHRWNDEERVDFKGKTRLIDAQADLGIAIDKLQGQLTVEALQKTTSQWPDVKLHLDAASLLASGRLVESLALDMHSTDSPGLLVIPQVTGQVYNGKLLGQGQVQLGDDPAYSLQATLHDAAVEPMVEPHTWEASQARAPLDGSPYAALSASVAMHGKPGDAASRQGRGNIDVRQANLYQTPLALRLLQIISLTLPTASSFDRAQASYVIDGDLVRFDSIRFETPTLALTGSGVMRFSTLELDMDFVTRRTAGPTLGPLGDLVSVIKDQIIAIHVGGTLGQPVTQVRSFSGIGRSWSDVFRGEFRGGELRGGEFRGKSPDAANPPARDGQDTGSARPR